MYFVGWYGPYERILFPKPTQVYPLNFIRPRLVQLIRAWRWLWLGSVWPLPLLRRSVNANKKLNTGGGYNCLLTKIDFDKERVGFLALDSSILSHGDGDSTPYSYGELQPVTLSQRFAAS